MTVYEMIQELAQYKADQEVEINVVADGYRTEVIVEEDVRENEETEVDVVLDEDITEFYIDEYKPYGKAKIVRINVSLD